jgi:hypothetical protein
MRVGVGSRPFEKSIRVSVSRRNRVISSAALLDARHLGGGGGMPARGAG